MRDLSYDEALAAAPLAHRVLLGPVPCAGCRASVEWAGVAWLAAGTLEPHKCPPDMPLLAARLYPRMQPRHVDQAHLMGWYPVHAHPWAAVLVVGGAVVLALVLVILGIKGLAWLVLG